MPAVSTQLSNPRLSFPFHSFFCFKYTVLQHTARLSLPRFLFSFSPLSKMPRLRDHQPRLRCGKSIEDQPAQSRGPTWTWIHARICYESSLRRIHVSGSEGGAEERVLLVMKSHVASESSSSSCSRGNSNGDATREISGITEFVRLGGKDCGVGVVKM